MYCINCGIELEEDMRNCPLCGTPVTGNGRPTNTSNIDPVKQQEFPHGHKRMSQPQRKFTWEIASVILLSATIATFSLDLIINKHITWSEYPVAISLATFSYISLFTFLNKNTFIRLIGSFILSSFFFVSLDALTFGISWSIELGIPLLFTGNLIVAALVAVIQRAKYKGINLIAYAFVAAALESICVDAILSHFKMGFFHIRWSLIIAASVVPIVVVLLFVHFRLKKGRRLERLFHT